MKLTQKNGQPHVWYDRLQQLLIDAAEQYGGHLNHECTEACDPPTETELIEFYGSLDERHRLLVDFIAHLHHHGFRLNATHWVKPPIEALETQGQH